MIYIMLSYARSGGTILNKCLGNFDNVIMLSEVNPMDNGNNPVYGKMDADKQCKIWYGIDLKSRDFRGTISECNEYCISHNKKLIIRDWSTVNFREMDENNFEPPNKFLLMDELKGIDELKIFTLIRNPIDLFISNEMDTKDLEGYFYFVKAIGSITNNKIIRYENFCRSPSEVLEDLTKYIDLEYSNQWKSYYKNEKVNGDSVIKGGSRGARQVDIKPLKRKRIGKKAIRMINDSPYIRYISVCLGYPSNYYEGAIIESRFDRLKFILRRGKTNGWI